MSPKTVLTVLLLINLLNYIDRQVLFAVFPLIKIDLNLSDSQLGLLGSAFMVVYTIAAPIIAYFADRSPRQIWISLCTFLWSIATIITGTIKGYWHLLVTRSFIGIGEAGFTSISPSFVAERFPSSQRARVLAIFGLALPFGSALGYLLGGVIGQYFGWRVAFYIVGAPGIILAVYVFLKMKDIRKVSSKVDAPKMGVYLDILRNKAFLFSALAQAMATFTLGGLAAWMPTYFHRYFNYSIASAGTVFGLLVIIAGILGTLGGGFVADKLLQKTSKAYFYTAVLGYALALPIALIGLLFGVKIIALIAFAVAMSFLFMQTGPLNAAIISITSLKIRSMAFALNVFLIHAFGDALSPWAIGSISDVYTLEIGVLFAVLFIIPAAIFGILAAKYFKGQEI